MYTGDGFTVFEEYRGFYVKGSHTSILPTDKDVFIYSELAEGIGAVSNLPTPIVTHEINFDEAYDLPSPDALPSSPIDDDDDDDDDDDYDPWINFNSCGDLLTVVQQKAVWVDKKGVDRTEPTLMGVTSPALPGPVHKMEIIEIFEETIKNIDIGLNTERNELGESLPTGVPQSTDIRISQIKSLVIGHEIGHAVGLYHPFSPILSSWRPAIARPRYHGRLRYDRVFCQYEKDRENPLNHNLYRPPTVRHGSPQKCGTSIRVWDSCSTIMDYGSETAIIAFHGSSGNRYSITSAAYLAAFQQSTTYLERIHNVEYMFVSPTVAAAHVAKTKWDPLRKSKPKWSPPDDGAGSDTNTETGSDTSTENPPPDQPYGLSYTIVDGEFRLLWTDGGGTVTGFQYRYRESGGSWGSWISAGLGTFIDLLNLVDGTTYQFQVVAMNGTVVSAISDTFEVTTPTVPDAPTITRVDSGDGQVNINWTAPSYNGGSDITGYKYRYRESNGGTWESWTSFGGGVTITSEDIAGLTNGTAYDFQVRAVNAVGEGTESNTFSATPVQPIIITLPPQPIWSDIPDPYNLTVGDSFSLDLNSYVTGSPMITRNGGILPAGLSFSNGVLSGTVTMVESRGIRFLATNLGGSENSEWIEISVSADPPPPVPVWSDIPDPYTLTIGDSFSLDLNSYVTGSPTITRNGGILPAGLYFSNGILSGTVTSVESRGIRFTATNVSGSVDSEWIEFTIVAVPLTMIAPVWSDIPDPYILTVGDSFSLDLNSYVTGSPTITKTGGLIPAGLSFSNGILSGTVTTVETRGIRFTATNAAGASLSEWVNFTIQSD